MKLILSIGFSFPGDEAEYVSFDSSRSLIDADIIIFSPDNIPFYNYTSETIEGNTLLNADHSRKLLHQAQHWREELSLALNEGKTVFMFLEKPAERAVRIHLESDSEVFDHPLIRAKLGRNIGLFNSSACLPVDIGDVVAKEGNKIVPSGDLGALSSYWKQFSKHSSYVAYLTNLRSGKPLLKTKSGDNVVGAIFGHGKGALVVLPPLDLEEMTEWSEEEGEDVWTEEGNILARSCSGR